MGNISLGSIWRQVIIFFIFNGFRLAWLRIKLQILRFVRCKSDTLGTEQILVYASTRAKSLQVSLILSSSAQYKDQDNNRSDRVAAVDGRDPLFKGHASLSKARGGNMWAGSRAFICCKQESDPAKMGRSRVFRQCLFNEGNYLQICYVLQSFASIIVTFVPSSCIVLILFSCLTPPTYPDFTQFKPYISTPPPFFPSPLSYASNCLLPSFARTALRAAVLVAEVLPLLISTPTLGLPSKHRILVCLLLARCHMVAATPRMSKTPNTTAMQMYQVEDELSSEEVDASVVELDEVAFPAVELEESVVFSSILMFYNNSNPLY